MAVEKYNYTCLQQNLISELDTFLTPLWDWVKVEKSENMAYGSNEPYINFYVDNKTALCFQLGYNYAYAAPVFQVSTTADSGTFSSRFDNGESSTYCANPSDTYKARVRFTKVGIDGFLFGLGRV